MFSQNQSQFPVQIWDWCIDTNNRACDGISRLSGQWPYCLAMTVGTVILFSPDMCNIRSKTLLVCVRSSRGHSTYSAFACRCTCMLDQNNELLLLTWTMSEQRLRGWGYKAARLSQVACRRCARLGCELYTHAFQTQTVILLFHYWGCLHACMEKSRQENARQPIHNYL